MAQVSQIIKSAPYYADFDPNKNYTKVLFKPGFPVQTRELIEMQSILSNQIASMGNHIFANGSPVLGGHPKQRIVNWIVIDSNFLGLPVNVQDFIGKSIKATDGASGQVVAVAASTATDRATLYYTITSSAEQLFKRAQTVLIDGQNTGAVIADIASFSGDAAVYSVQSGVYFIEDHFVFVDAQQILPAKYSVEFDGVVGFNYKEKAINVLDDENLYDPARGSLNPQAPGADRLKVFATLEAYENADTKPDKFIEIFKIVDGIAKDKVESPVYSVLGDQLARRTYDESGSYTVRPFLLSLTDHNGIRLKSLSNENQIIAHQAQAETYVNHFLKVGDPVKIAGVTGPNKNIYNGEFIVDEIVDDFNFKFTMLSIPTASSIGNDIKAIRTDHMTAQLSPGKAYIFGFEQERISSTDLSIKRAVDTVKKQNLSMFVNFSNYVFVENVSGILDPTHLEQVELRDTNSVLLATARIKAFERAQGTKFRLYLYDFNFIGVKNFDEVRIVTDPISSGQATIHADSISNGKAFVTGNNSKSIFDVPGPKMKTLKPNTVPSLSFTSKKKINGVAVAGAVSFALATNQFFIGPQSSDFAGTATELNNYLFFNGATIEAVANITISPTRQLLTVQLNAAVNGPITLLASIKNENVESSTVSITTETKVLTHTIGQTEYDLGTSYVFRVNSIVDQNTNDVASLFGLNAGVSDNFVGHSSLELIGTTAIPGLQDNNTFTVIFEKINIVGAGPLTIDSYNTTIQKQLSANFFNTLDFRPRRVDVGTDHEGVLLVPGTEVQFDSENYMRRRDLIVIDTTGELTSVTGTPGFAPQWPAVPERSLALYRLEIDSFTQNPAVDVKVKQVETRRYTMRDIGRLEKRVDRLEYYTTLNLLEMNALNKSVTDANGLDRFKNGMIVDNFSKPAFRAPDHIIGVDAKKRELRPAFKTTNIKMDYDAASSGNANNIGNDEIGKFVTLPFTEKPYISIINATQAESLNPFLLVSRIGTIYCNPPSDDWKSEDRLPVRRVDLGTGIDEVVRVFNESGILDTEYGSWQNQWSSSSAVAGSENTTSRTERTRTTSTVRGWRGQTRRAPTEITTTINTTTWAEETRTGQARNVTVETLNSSVHEESLGDRVVDVSLAHWMREISIQFVVRGMRASTDCYVFVDDVNMDDEVTPGVGFTPQRGGSCRASDRGEIRGVLHIPGNIFRTGERTIKFIDEPSGVDDDASTVAKYVFASSGLINQKEETVVSTRDLDYSHDTHVENRVITSRRQLSREAVTGRTTRIIWPRDPLAQTFTVGSDAPNGMFVTSIDLFFKRKDDNENFWIELRPTVNGFPHSSVVLPLSRVYVEPENIALPVESDNITSILAAPTKVNFPVPIFLQPGTEYALVVLANTTDHEVFISQLGQTVLGTNNIAAAQEDLGSLFKSQNGTTWTPFQNQDLCYKLNRADFDTAAVVNAKFKNAIQLNEARANVLNYNYGVVNIEPVTAVTSHFKIKDEATGQLSTEFLALENQTSVELEAEGLIEPGATTPSLTTEIVLSTNSNYVAPILDLSRNSMILVANQINNLGLEDNFVTTDEGSGYDPSNPPAVTITGGGGTGATASAIVSTDGRLLQVILLESGSNFTSAPVVTVAGNGTVEYAGNFEDYSSFGNAKARYISTIVRLAEDFETDKLTLFMDVNIPLETKVEVYFRGRAVDDARNINLIKWRKMTQSEVIISNDPDQFTELTWDSGDVTYTDGTSTWTIIKDYQFKVVLLSSNTSVVPRCRDFRGISTIA